MAEPVPFDRRRVPDGMTLADWIAPDGWRLRRFDWPPPAGVSPRGRMLFQTGRADFIEKYLEAVAHWREAGWHVAGFDWRGQGGSGRDAGGVPMARMLADLVAFAAEWRAAGPGPYVAIGHSMGGHLLLRAMAEGMRFDAAVLVAPMLGLNTRPFPATVARGIAWAGSALGLGERPLWRPGRRGRRMTRARQAMLTGCPDRYADELHWMAAAPDLVVAPLTFGWLGEAFAANARLSAPGMLERVADPVLLLGTTRDRLVDPRAIATAAARLPRARLILRDDAAHELLRERDAVRLPVLAAIDGFLAGVAA